MGRENNPNFDKLKRLDRSYQDVKDFESHPICVNLGWDATMLRSLIDANLMGGGYNRKDRAYLTSELFLYLATRERIGAIGRRLEIEKKMSDD